MTHATSTLNDVIETLKDGQEGFRTAAEDVENPQLKSLFREYSQQRAKLAAELQSLARSLGESEPEDNGSVGGALHRGWIDLKSALASRDEHAILAECERGEDVAVKTYKDALDDPDLPANVRQILQSQFAAVKAAHDRVRDLRDSLKGV
ncbi:MAG TPA: PA2169 family four-helix-bundle protein [Prosthecobacter sp.]|nr:PA2169 family four-helix-bundle protein [Prosthecobacter sp.]